MSKRAIFIFTKDRPQTLNKTLASIEDATYTKYLIDDSITNKNQQLVSLLCNYYSNCVYLGKSEFNKFIIDNSIDFLKFNFLLRSVGSTEWNLGYARNFALLYSKFIGLENVLFSDDDIQVYNTSLIEELFQSLDNYQIVGANILGLVDDSVLGHIATEKGIINERMLSGGFMIFNPSKIDHFFLNNYNEDWIWLFLQLKGKKYLQTGEVFQELIDPYINYEHKVIFQEFGEIALDGILDLYKQGSYNELVQLAFWERMIKERKEYLDLLLSISIKKGNKRHINIVQYIKSNFKNFNPVIYKTLFEKYFYNRNLFQCLYNSLS